MNKTELLTTTEAAGRIGITKSGLVQLMDIGKFTIYRQASGVRLLLADEVDEFIEQRSKGVKRMPVKAADIYDMVDITCPECSTLFSILAVSLAQLYSDGDDITCPICGEKSSLEPEEEEEDEDQDEEEEEEEGSGCLFGSGD